jgi:FlaA1/EpsC-like NDP-sugar epimerase|tara:strand:+ start:2501 stop:3451 length:951 start_codon:yes stop_codon:yes gene_type:complete
MNKERILIIGGTGALGSTLAKRYYDSNDIMVVSRNEHKQEAMKLTFPNITYRLGDVKDKQSLVRNLYEFEPTVVINTAAVKTVWVCQENSYESVQTNITGHQNLIDAVQECNHKINTLVFISTDKACKPVNVYGMSKAIAEQLYVNFAKQQSSIKVVMARYGNVLNSTGSIIPVFKNMIENGYESLPITDFGMTRFLLTLNQAIDLIEWAYNHPDSHGKIAIPKIESLNIAELALAIAKACGKEDMKLHKIPIRDGEKLHEEMISEIEFQRTEEFDNYYLIGFNKTNESYDHKPYNSKYFVTNDVDEFLNKNKVNI